MKMTRTKMGSLANLQQSEIRTLKWSKLVSKLRSAHSELPRDHHGQRWCGRDPLMTNEEDSNNPSWGFLVGAAQANSGAAQAGKQLHEVDWSRMRSKRAAIELGRRRAGLSLARLGDELQVSWFTSSNTQIGAVEVFMELTQAGGRSTKWRGYRKKPRRRKVRATRLDDLEKSGAVRRRLRSGSRWPRSELLRATFAVRTGHQKGENRRSYSEPKWVSGG